MNENSKYFKLVKGLTFFGGMVNFIYSLFYLLNIKDLESWINILGFQDVIFMMIGMIVAGFAILLAVKPNDPIPLHWFILVVFSIMLMLFSFMGGGLLLLVATVFIIIDDVKNEQKIE